jgi:hypothetical protein
VTNFDEEFTSELPILTPIITELDEVQQEEFKNFSYTAHWMINPSTIEPVKTENNDVVNTNMKPKESNLKASGNIDKPHSPTPSTKKDIESLETFSKKDSIPEETDNLNMSISQEQTKTSSQSSKSLEKSELITNDNDMNIPLMNFPPPPKKNPPAQTGDTPPANVIYHEHLDLSQEKRPDSTGGKDRVTKNKLFKDSKEIVEKKSSDVELINMNVPNESGFDLHASGEVLRSKNKIDITSDRIDDGDEPSIANEKNETYAIFEKNISNYNLDIAASSGNLLSDPIMNDKEREQQPYQETIPNNIENFKKKSVDGNEELSTLLEAAKLAKSASKVSVTLNTRPEELTEQNSEKNN